MYNDNGLGYPYTSKGAMQNTDAFERYISTKTLLLTIKNYYIDDQSDFRHLRNFWRQNFYNLCMNNTTTNKIKLE